MTAVEHKALVSQLETSFRVFSPVSKALLVGNLGLAGSKHLTENIRKQWNGDLLKYPPDVQFAHLVAFTELLGFFGEETIFFLFLRVL